MHCIRKNQIPTNIRSSVHHWIRLHPIRCHLLRYRGRRRKGAIRSKGRAMVGEEEGGYRIKGKDSSRAEEGGDGIMGKDSIRGGVMGRGRADKNKGKGSGKGRVKKGSN